VSRIIPRSQWREQPWKNAGGVTHEIVRWPDSGDYDLRVSLAEVTRPGPFSTFPGYRRWSILVSGELELVASDRVHHLAPGTLLELAGETAVTARLPAGPATLLNLLAKPAWRAGIGPTERAAWFTFDLATHEARVLDPPALVTSATLVWITRV
jgi:uncharacterized protein